METLPHELTWEIFRHSNKFTTLLVCKDWYNITKSSPYFTHYKKFYNDMHNNTYRDDSIMLNIVRKLRKKRIKHCEELRKYINKTLSWFIAFNNGCNFMIYHDDAITMISTGNSITVLHRKIDESRSNRLTSNSISKIVSFLKKYDLVSDEDNFAISLSTLLRSYGTKFEN